MGMHSGDVLRYRRIVRILSGMLALLLFTPFSVQADDGANKTDRKTTITTTVKIYQWQMKFWSDRTVACAFTIDHDGQPTDGEIQTNCTYQQYQTWKDTPTCNAVSGEGTQDCKGVYLINLNSEPLFKTVEVTLSPPSVWLSLAGCEYSESEDYCTGDPSLVFSGEEPLPNEHITRIRGRIGSKDFDCGSGICTVSLPETANEGIEIVFQGDSSFGDKTEEFTARARVVRVEGTENSYYIDILSNQWLGRNPPGCSEIWQVFPESTTLPDWLNTPNNSTELQSSKTLYYLAAALINNGVVDASTCQGGGLENNYTANECGVTAAGPAVKYWQNQFDEEIITVAKMDSIPANLMKNIFARESQFWPGIYEKVEEVGFGHLTENGADATLLWNRVFYDSFCPLILDQSVCDQGFAQLSNERKEILIGALMQRTNATCPQCESGIDLTKADFSIHIFAEALKANCSQVDQEIHNATQKSAHEVSSYTDLWRFTLLNYNAGAGCLSNAFYRTSAAGQPIDWEHVAANLPPVCQQAVNYVIDVTEGNTKKIDAFSTSLPTGTPTLAATETPTLSPTPTQATTPTIAPTETMTPTNVAEETASPEQ